MSTAAMATGDPPPFMPWSDALGYMPWLQMPATFGDPMGQVCTQCGALLRDHIIGGPAPYHPVTRAALWFWD